MRTEKKAVGVLKTKCWLAGGRTAGRSEQHSYCLGRHLRPDRDYDGQCGMNGRVARYEANSQYEYNPDIRTRPESEPVTQFSGPVPAQCWTAGTSDPALRAAGLPLLLGETDFVLIMSGFEEMKIKLFVLELETY